MMMMMITMTIQKKEKKDHESFLLASVKYINVDMWMYVCEL